MYVKGVAHPQVSDPRKLADGGWEVQVERNDGRIQSLPYGTRQEAAEAAALMRRISGLLVAPPPQNKGDTPRWRDGMALKLTREVIDKIAENLVGCPSKKDAALAAGVPTRTFDLWERRGRMALEKIEQSVEEDNPFPLLTPDEELYLDLGYAVNTGRAKERIKAARDVRAGGPGWQGAAKALSWSSEDYNPVARSEMSGPGGGPLETLQVQVAERNEKREEMGIPPLVIVSRSPAPNGNA